MHCCAICVCLTFLVMPPENHVATTLVGSPSSSFQVCGCYAVLGQLAEAGIMICLYDCYGHGASAPFEEHLRALVQDPLVGSFEFAVFGIAWWSAPYKELYQEVYHRIWCHPQTSGKLMSITCMHTLNVLLRGWTPTVTVWIDQCYI